MTGIEYTLSLVGRLGRRSCGATGAGAIDPDSGTARLQIESESQALGDLACGIPALCMLGAVVAARPMHHVRALSDPSVAQSSFAWPPAVEQGYTAIRRTDGDTVVELRFSADTASPTPPWHGQFHICSDQPSRGQVTALDGFVTMLVPTAPDRVLATANYGVAFDDGTSGQAITFCPLTVQDPARQLAGVQPVTVAVVEPAWTQSSCVVVTESAIEPAAAYSDR